MSERALECVICHESKLLPPTEFSSSHNHFQLRQHLVTHHFSSYRPFKCNNCNHCFGDRTFMDLVGVTFCCDGFNKLNVSVVFDEQPLIQSLLDMLVSHSVTLQTQGNLKAVTQKVANAVQQVSRHFPLPQLPDTFDLKCLSPEEQVLVKDNVVGMPPFDI